MIRVYGDRLSKAIISHSALQGTHTVPVTSIMPLANDQQNGKYNYSKIWYLCNNTQH